MGSRRRTRKLEEKRHKRSLKSKDKKKKARIEKIKEIEQNKRLESTRKMNAQLTIEAKIREREGVSITEDNKENLDSQMSGIQTTPSENDV